MERARPGPQRIDAAIVKEEKLAEVGCPQQFNQKPSSLEKEVLEVHIDKGMTNGHKIPFRGYADEEPGIEPGDVVFVLREAEHDVFTRKGWNLAKISF